MQGFFCFVFSQHIKLSNARELENPKQIENLETVTERYKKLKEKLERIDKIKEVKKLETTNKGLEELEKEKKNKTIVNNPRKMLLTHFSEHVCQLIK